MRPAVVALVLLLLVPAALPFAQGQTGYVKVTFRFGAGTDSAASPFCFLTVPAGANGADVIRAAFRQMCIHQYSLSGSSGATRLVCLDGVCNLPAGVSWQQYHDGVQVAGGLESFSASEGATLGVAYTATPPPATLPDPSPYLEAVTRFMPEDGSFAYYTDTDNDGFPNEVYVWTLYGSNANPDTWYADYELKWDVDGGQLRHPLQPTNWIDVPPLDPLP